MNNFTRIRLFQRLPQWLALQLYRFRHRRTIDRSGSVAAIPLVRDVDHFPTATPKTRRALLALSPAAWLTAVAQHPRIRMFNYSGLSYEIVRALNLNGYVVDVCDHTREHVPDRDYDLFVGHGGNCRPALAALGDRALVFQYISGAHWKAFQEESAARYERFARSRGIESPQRFQRDLSDLLQGEEALLQRADCLFTIDCPRMIGTFGSHREKFFFTGLGAYLDEKLQVPHAQRNHEQGRRRFIYVGGTGGNIQKGLDVLLEAFATLPDLHLYIYCRVEDEVLDHYRRELSLPNIHYIHHLRFGAFQGELKRLMEGISFSIHAPINSGMGTAFMGTLGLGLIPVGYVDLPADPCCTVLCDSWQVDALIATIRRASEMPVDWCRDASYRIRDVYEEQCGEPALRRRFEALFADSHVAVLRRRKATRPTAWPADPETPEPAPLPT